MRLLTPFHGLLSLGAGRRPPRGGRAPPTRSCRAAAA